MESMNRNERGHLVYSLLMCAGSVVIVSIAAAVWVIGSKFEADAFNRITGANATTWEAMWTQLRVTGSPTQ